MCVNKKALLRILIGFRLKKNELFAGTLIKIRMRNWLEDRIYPLPFTARNS